MKKMLILMIFSLAAILFSGCTSTTPIVQKNVQTKKVEVLPYKVYQKGMVVSSTKVLIDASYESKIQRDRNSRNSNLIEDNSNVKKDVKLSKTLYKTIVFSKDKKYEIFINTKLDVGSVIEFILDNEILTNIIIKE